MSLVVPLLVAAARGGGTSASPSDESTKPHTSQLPSPSMSPPSRCHILSLPGESGDSPHPFQPQLHPAFSLRSAEADLQVATPHVLPVAFPRAAQCLVGRLERQPALPARPPPAVSAQKQGVAHARVPIKECQDLLRCGPEWQASNLRGRGHCSCISWRAAECDAPADCSASAGSMLARSAEGTHRMSSMMAHLDSAAVRLDNPLLRARRAPAMLPRRASRGLALQQA